MTFSHSFPRPANTGTISFGLYLHTPFCVHKCSYCDFYSFAKYAPSDFARLAGALVGELLAAHEFLKDRQPPKATSVFFGGGTPSLLPVAELAAIFSSALGLFPAEPDAEITLEANPETVTEELAAAWLAKTPVNRVSMGAQSFQLKFLKTLERLCPPEAIVAAAGMLKRAGVRNFNLDLIFGIPGQTLPDVIDDIDRAVALEPNHISFYSLTLKPGHTLYPTLPDDDFSADLYEAGVERLAKAGYAQYEISNFAKPGYESRHNLLYWNGGDYLGIGPSAASRFFWDGTFHHRKAPADIVKYLEGTDFPAPGFEATTPAQTILEATFLELRRNEGVDVTAFHSRYGYDLTSSPKFNLFVNEKLLEREGPRLRLTDRGRLLADEVTRELAV